MKDKTISCFSVSFRKGFESPNVPLATFTQGDKELTFLLDSGSMYNVTNKKALDNIEHTILNDGSHTHTLSGVGGTEEVSKCSITFQCGKESYTTEFLVSESVNTAFELIRKEHGIVINGLLGSAFMKDHNVVLDFQNYQAYSKQ